MVTVEDCILGNGELHGRFLATTEILARLVSCAPRAVSEVQLVEDLGYSSSDIAALCAELERAGMLHAEPLAIGRWQLTCAPDLVTLEDVFRCVLASRGARKRSGSRARMERPANDVDLLVTQATIAINQSVFAHLRRFSLDRLKISAAGMFPTPRRALPNTSLDDEFSDAALLQDRFHVSGGQISI